MLAAFAIAGQTAGPVSGQDVVEVGDEPYCDCVVTFQHVVTIGSLDGPDALPGGIRQMVRNSEGIYLVLPWQDHRVLRFDARGRALPHVAPEGEGPGEVLRPTHLTLLADSVLIWDQSNGRVTVFDPDLRYARSVSIPGVVWDAVPLDSASFLVNGRIRSPAGRWAPLYVLDARGKALRAFGVPVAPLDPPARQVRRISGDEGTVWAATETRYTLRLWSEEGSLLREIVRTAEWWIPFGDGSWGPDKPMPTKVVDMVVDGGRYLRTIVRLPSPDWREILPPPRGPAGVHPVPPGTGLFRSVVEIIDPVGARLIATGASDHEFHGFVDERHVFSYREDELGVPIISVWRLSLESSAMPGSAAATLASHGR